MDSTGVFAAEDLTTAVSIEAGLTGENFADEELFEDLCTSEAPPVEDVYTGEEPLVKDKYADGEPFIEDTDAGEEPLAEDTYVDEETLTEDAYVDDEALTDDAYADDEVLSEEACTEEEPLLNEEYTEEDSLAAFEEEDYPSDEGTCGENLTWRLDGGVLTISGTGAMADYEPENFWGQLVGSTAPWNEYKYGKGVSRVIIEEGVTSIGDYAFVIFDDAEFELADSIERIGQYGLFRAGFESVKLPEHLTEIGPFALADNTNLLELSIPEGVTKLSRGLFWWTSLRRISLPASLTEIEYAAFQYADLTFVDYGGTRADWEQLIIGEENEVLENVVIHFADDPPAVLSGSCGKRVAWVLDEEGTLTVGGQGPMDDYEMTTVPGGSIRDGYCDADRVDSPWWGVCNKVKR